MYLKCKHANCSMRSTHIIFTTELPFSLHYIPFCISDCTLGIILLFLFKKTFYSLSYESACDKLPYDLLKMLINLAIWRIWSLMNRVWSRKLFLFRSLKNITDTAPNVTSSGGTILPVHGLPHFKNVIFMKKRQWEA